MSTAYSYPGIYIQEVPLSTHTITPTPTSITAFVGYTHPWKTAAFKTAVQLFSFTDYENYFGGLYTSGLLCSDLARAVNAFFQNGGNNAWVVGLQPEAIGATTSVQFGSASDDLCFVATINPDATQPTVGMQFQALEPTDIVPMTATVTNLRTNPASATPNAYTLFDLVITYGVKIEVYRSVDLTLAQGAPKSVDKLINGVSSLVTAQPITGTSYGTQFPVAGGATLPIPPGPATFSLQTLASPPGGLPTGFVTTFNAGDFLPVFQENSSLDNVSIFNLLLVPGVSDNVVLSAALAFAERKRAFAIVDPPPQATAFAIPGSPLPSIDKLGPAMPTSQNGALYFPYLNTTDPVSGLPIAVAPSGYVAGACATTDSVRGVWKAPAGIGTPLLGTTGPVPFGLMNDPQQGVLNLDSINCLRNFTGIGTVVYGARTLVADNQAFAQSKYVPVRRMTLFIEQTLVANLKWVVFEPNDEPLWLAIKSSIEAFLLSLFNQQALQGSTPSEAFQVKVDSTTTTPADQQNGIVNIVVGVALLKPAEFVVILISQLAGQTS
jgi:phage tail sheath protein FI